MHLSKLLFPLLTLLLALFSCHAPTTPPDEKDSVVCGADGAVDTVVFRATHHYCMGDGFTNKADGNEIIVTEITPSTDSAYYIVFVEEIGDDSLTLRRFSEQRFLNYAVPANPISKLILLCSDFHALPALIVVVVCSLIWIVLRRRRQRLPLISAQSLLTLSLLILAGAVLLSTALYAALRHWQPEVWDAYYFHPTLNPLHPALTPLASAVLASFWLVIVLGVTVVNILISYIETGSRH